MSSAGRAKDVTIVRAIHGGNWKPEPYALDAFRDWIEPERNLKVRLIDHPLHLIHELDPLPQLVIASGIDAHEFTPAQKQAIKQCVERGGRILFESPGGNGAFVLSAEEMAMTMFDDPIRAVHRDPAMTGAGIDGAEDLSRVEYRPFALETFGSRETTPRLRGITVGGKTPILFSREDISHALLDQPCWGVAGYAPDSARRMLANTLLEAMSSNE